MPSKFYLGVDVSKNSLSVVLQNGAGKILWSNKKIQNNISGFKHMIEQAEKHATKQAGDKDYTISVGVESTGAYSEALSYYIADNCKDGKVLLYMLNPAAVKSYREALLLHNKNDAADAKLIAMFVASMTESGQIEPWKAPAKAERGLKELTRRRADLVSQRDAERNRLEQLSSGASATQAVIKNVREHITLLEELIREIEAEIEKHIDDSGLRETTELLRSIDGIGPVSSSTFIGEMGDLERYQSVKNLVSRVGIAPKERQSGTSLHVRSVISRRGNKEVRQALYMAALVATQKNEVISAFYKRLLERGKCKKVALIACMRKLLHIIWGVLTHRQPFNPAYAP